MNAILATVVAAVGKAPANTGGPASAKAAQSGGELFRTALDSALPSRASALSVKSVLPARAPGSAAERAAQAKIAKLIASGASPAEIVASLAADLAKTVADKLGLGDDARGKLQSVFSAALSPPGQPAATDAGDLAQRYAQLETLATQTADDQLGQQKRLTGTLLDAYSAKDIPARPTSAIRPAPSAAQPPAPTFSPAPGTVRPTAPLPAPGMVRPTAPLPAPGTVRPTGALPAAGSAASAAQPPVSAASAAPAAAAVLPVPAPPPAVSVSVTGRGDGRTVNLGAKAAVATGGDTTLGRILTRAALSADARPVSAAAAAADAGAADTQSAGAHAPPAPPEPGLAAFLKSLTAALAAADGEGPAVPPHAVPVAAAAGAAPHALAADNSAAPIVPAIAPLTFERGSPARGAGAAEPTQAPEPVDQSAIADQVLRGAFMRNVGQSSEMRLSLVPETLGDVSVKLVVTAGTVSAHVVAETSQVRDALVAAQPQLTKSLADAGLKLSSFTVDLSSNFDGFANQQRNDSSADARRTAGRADTADADDDTAIEAIPTFGPSQAGAVPGDYNYLA